MYCSSCGEKNEQSSKYCYSCGNKIIKTNLRLPGIITILLFTFVLTIAGGIFWWQNISPDEGYSHVEKSIELTEKETKTLISNKDVDVEVVNQESKPKQPKDVSEIIQLSQPKVFTIYTAYGQGSGFLIDSKGHVLTNAHVVEGDFTPFVRTMDGSEHQGKLVGYSNTTDIAIIEVPGLAGMQPLQMEEQAITELGDEVIALGSPKGYENTATLGNISGIDRTFVIPPFEYKGIYQMSAPIAPGSSGGPLLSKESGKVIAVNSARDSYETNIGFSIPIYQISSMINDWIRSPMQEDDIYALFYYDSDIFYFNDYLDSFGYFDDGGYYDEGFDDYYEIPFEDSWYDYWEEEWYWDEYWYEDYEYYDEYDYYEDYDYEYYEDYDYEYYDEYDYYEDYDYDYYEEDDSDLDEEYNDYESENWEDYEDELEIFDDSATDENDDWEEDYEEDIEFDE